MTLLSSISFHFSRKIPVILQNETAESGLACLGMIMGFYGGRSDLSSLRREHPVSVKGMSLTGLTHIAHDLNMVTRPFKISQGELTQLKLPCILHWSAHHFVVLKEVGIKHAILLDPEVGERKITKQALIDNSLCAGVECWPTTQFRHEQHKPSIKIRTLLGHLNGWFPSFVQILLLALALEVFAVVSPFFLQWVIDQVIVSHDRDLLMVLVVGFGTLMLLQQGIGAVRSWVILYLGTTLNIQWRANVFNHLIRLPVDYFEKRHLGDVVSRFGSIELIQRTLTTSFLEAILDGMMMLVTLAMMLLYSPKLAIISVIAMSVYGLARAGRYLPLRTATEQQIVHAARQQSHFLETVRGIRTIKLFQRENERRSAWLALAVDQINADLRTQKLQLSFRVLNGVLFGVENILIIYFGASLVMDGVLTVGVLMAFIAYKTLFDNRAVSLVDKYFDLKMLQLQGERLADIVLTEPEAYDGRGGMPVEVQSDPDLTLIKITYRYPQSDNNVLNQLSLHIPYGQSLAIIGVSGCGKTTLINVILGVLESYEGEVLIGGVNAKQCGLEQLRSMIGTVLQDDVLFAGTIADNICFFDATPDLAWMKACAVTAQIAAEIDAMPMNYNTLVGDMGAVVSGGQKQRILLARALYKRPKILLLDEATSHLDTNKEASVNAAVRALKMTRIMVAHRPETIASADRIVELANGNIINDRKNTEHRERLQLSRR